MTISQLTSEELSGVGIGPEHGVAQSRLNEVITQVNANTSALGGATNPFHYVGVIALAASFPTSAAVKSGDVYKITADVTDNDGTKTNTGQSFIAGSDIFWNGTAWEIIGDNQETGIASVSTTPYNVAEGIHTVLVDTATIGGASVINLPALAVKRKSREIVVIDVGGSGGANNIAVTPDGTELIDGVNAPKTIDINYGAIEVITNGVDWFTNGATAHALGNGDDHESVALNNAHRASAGLDHSYLKNNLVDAVIVVADAPAGATDALLTADLKDLSGAALAKAGVLLIEASTTLYHGARTKNTHITLGTVTKGSILANDAANGWWLVKTDANGQFACTATNGSDETVYFTCTTSQGGVDAVANGVIVRGCVPDDATWSA